MCCIGPGGSVCQHNHGSQTKNKLCRAKSFSNISKQNISKTYPLNFQHLSPLSLISSHFIAFSWMLVLNKTPQSLRHGNGEINTSSPSTTTQPTTFSQTRKHQSTFADNSAKTYAWVWYTSVPFFIFLHLSPSAVHTQPKQNARRLPWKWIGSFVFIDYWKVWCYLWEL